MRSRKPCHGCGSTVLHESGNVCDNCQSLILEGHRSRQERRTKETDTGTLFAHNYAGSFQPGVINAREYTEAIQQLLNILQGSHKPNEATYSYDYPVLFETESRGSSQCELVRLPQATRDSISHLNAVVHQLVRTAYQRGMNEGSSILMKLRDGTISVDEFERKVTR